VVIAAGLMGDDAEQVQRVGMLRLHGEDLPVERLRVRKPAGLVVLERELKGFWNGHAAGRGVCFAHHARHIWR
jgi:hypothetical protein